MDGNNPSQGGLMLDNIVGFGRALRSAGVPLGPGAAIEAMQALSIVGVTKRDDVFAAFQSIFIKSQDHALIFAQAFDLFFNLIEEWQQLLDANLLSESSESQSSSPVSRRLQEAVGLGEPVERQERQVKDLQLSVSDQEVLQNQDFAQMSAKELAEAMRAVRQMTLPLADQPTRRFTSDPKGRRFDFRRTLRDSLRNAGEVIRLRHLGAQRRPPPIVVLLDISGSMSEYTRMFLHFLHAVTDARKRVSVFLFGTRLSNITRALRVRDPDAALAKVSSTVEDWSGGTRIATSLHDFNRLWGRRVLGQGAIVLLITDGLEREADVGLSFEMDRLRRSCRRLIWLNPLLRFDGFEAKARGIKMMLPHVDEFRPIHNLNSIQSLVDALSGTSPRRHRLSQLLPHRAAA
jgi:uncharacterized protein with von Willebrand factor type A (vWA) domain